MGRVGVLLFLLIGGIALLSSMSSKSAPAAPPGPTPQCSQIVTSAFYGDLNPIIARWKEVDRLASSTPRISLSPLVGQMQELRAKAGQVTATQCTAPVRTAVVVWMELGVQWWLLFLQNAPTADLNRMAANQKVAADAYDAARAELDRKSR